MRSILLKILGLVVLNLVLIWGHHILFQSPYPFLVFLSLLIHLAVIIKIPYEKMFKKEGE
jgi:hypothetical protein